MPLTLTESQKKAHDSERHLSVTANAGSGKTMVLVHRYVDILLKANVNVSDVVAITFTEKAASELKKKIADSIEERISQAKDPLQQQRFESIREGLASANIGTIHSFCARLLRDFPVEAGVDANFAVLEGIDRNIFTQESTTEAFEAALSDEEARPQLMTTLRMLSQEGVRRIIELMIRKHEQAQRLVGEGGLYTKSDDEILSLWQERIGSYVCTLVNAPEWLEEIKTVVEFSAGKLKPEVEGLLSQFESTTDLHQRTDLYQQITSKVFTKGPSDRHPRDEFVGRNVDQSPIDSQVKSLLDHLKSVEELLGKEATEVARTHSTLLRLTRTLLALYRKVMECYEGRKAENGQLDFDDLQLRTKLLLQNEEVRKKLAERFKYIMVDEYQDTNLVQYDILRPLITNYTTGNLFVVGDDKQSIYGFRGAEVEVFNRTRDEISGSQSDGKPFLWGEEVTSDVEERRGRIILSESFRLLTDLVAFVNFVFKQVMGERISRYEVEYSPLVKARRTDASGKIEMLLLPNDGKDPEDTQEEMIARRIVKLVESGQIVWKEGGTEDEVPQPIQFGDVAILLRKRKHLPSIEGALLKHRIPYIISGGVGFYQTQEVYDFFNYFQFLLNRHNDVALAGILRSPFFGISDAGLYEVALVEQEDADMWSKAQHYAEKPEASTRIRFAVATLRKDLELAGRISIPSLIDRILLQTGWLGTVAGGMRGELNVANLDKLLDIAREFEGKGFNNLFDFAERLELLISDEEREGQATVDTSGRAVQIMTIHAAKGLEFPVVILPYLEGNFRYDAAPYLDTELGLGFELPDPEDDTKTVRPLIAKLIKLAGKNRTEAEEKRVFYVGATRARDMLILAGNFDPKNSKPSYLRWTMDSLGLSQMPVTKKIKRESPTKIWTMTETGHELKEVNHAFEIEFITSSADIEIEDKDIFPKKAPANFDNILLDRFKSHAYNEFFSATQIQTYKQCPTKYYLRYRLGMPEAIGVEEFDEESEDSDMILGQLVGKMTHELFQIVDPIWQEEEKIKEQLDTILVRNGVIDPDKITGYKAQVFENVEKYIGSEFGKRIHSLNEFFCEQSIIATFDDEFLTGTIDRTFRNEGGHWEILDYKTDEIDGRNLSDYAGYYEHQMAFYALLIKRSFPVQPSVTATLFFTKHPDNPQTSHFGGEVLGRIEEEIRESIRGIRQKVDNVSEPLPTQTPQCHRCAYFVGGSCLMKR